MTFVVPIRARRAIAFLIGTMHNRLAAAAFVAADHRRTTRRLGAGTIVGAPMGVVILRVASASALRLTLGVVVCVAAVWIIVSSRRSNRPANPHVFRIIAMGIASGVLSTSLATNGYRSWTNCAAPDL